MTSTPLWENERWQILIPDQSLTRRHVAIVDRASGRVVDVAAAAQLLDAYRRTRSALCQVTGAQGFGISFAVAWVPDQDAIGEPEPIGAGLALHVFGRGPGDEISPNRAMAVRRAERHYAEPAPETLPALADALTNPAQISIPAPSDAECDGCCPEVLTKQERWRADGVRVIRPRHVMIDSQVIIMPLRHVVSLGDLRSEEVASIVHRLAEVRSQFNAASGSTGLNCFANDGSAARQETPHVHLHVFGRARDEVANPFELLAQRFTSTG